MEMTSEIDVSNTILELGRLLHGLSRLAADPEFTWRYEDEPGSLIQTVRNARLKAEDLRTVPEPERGQRLRLIWNALPHARIQQLLGDDTEAA